jgi:hypothetical protein
VWLLDTQGSWLLGIDTTSGNMLRVGVGGRYPSTSNLVSDGLRVWIAFPTTLTDQSVEVNGSTGQVVRFVPVPSAAPIVAAPEGLWMLDEGGSLLYYDLEHEHTVVRLDYGRPPAQTAVAPTAAFEPLTETIWVADSAHSITALDLAPGSGIATSPVPLVTQTVQGVAVTHRASWTLVDLWPLARSIATWPEPVGNSISVPDDTPERGGLPVLQLSNENLGLQSSCGDNLMGHESFLYVALNGGPFRVNPDGTPIWKSELSEADGPCGRGWYAYKTAEGGDAPTDMTTSTPYLVFAGFGPNVSQGDRQAVFAAFDSLEFVPFDYLRPPAQDSPRYVSPGRGR